jgi:AcrR family transcriptional regulator
LTHQRVDDSAVTDRRQDILLAAFDCVAGLGWGGCDVRRVAAEAGVDEASVVAHFPRRFDLPATLGEHIIGRLRRTLPADGRPSQRLHDHLEGLAQLTRDRPTLLLVLGEIELRARRLPLLRAALHRAEREWCSALTTLLRHGSECGAWRTSVDELATAELIVATARAAHTTRPPGCGLEQLDLLITGLEAVPTRRAA